MRIMKGSKTLSHKLLVVQVIEQMKVIITIIIIFKIIITIVII